MGTVMRTVTGLSGPVRSCTNKLMRPSAFHAVSRFMCAASPIGALSGRLVSLKSLSLIS